MIWLVIWVVLMMFWLFGGGVWVYNQPAPSFPAYGVGTLIPWLCVLLLGLFVFGALKMPPGGP